MKIKSSETFTWIHKGNEIQSGNKEKMPSVPMEVYHFSEKPVEITKEAYEHLITVFGEKWFTIVDEEKEKEKEKKDK